MIDSSPFPVPSVSHHGGATKQVRRTHRWRPVVTTRKAPGSKVFLQVQKFWIEPVDQFNWSGGRVCHDPLATGGKQHATLCMHRACRARGHRGSRREMLRPICSATGLRMMGRSLESVGLVGCTTWMQADVPTRTYSYQDASVTRRCP